MPTMTLKYACPSGYFSGASIPSKSVSRTGISGAPSDSYTYYKITKWSASFQGQVYPSAGVNCNLVVAGNAFTISCGSSSSTKTFSGWGGGPFNTAILDSGQTGTLTVGVSRNSGGSGNALLIKSEMFFYYLCPQAIRSFNYIITGIGLCMIRVTYEHIWITLFQRNNFI